MDGCTIDINISASNNMSRDALLALFGQLGRVTVKTTLTLGNLRYKLTADDIKLVTDKGWTVA